MEDEIDLREYLAVIIKHWKIIAGISIVTMLCAFIYSMLQKPIYEAKVSILLKGSSSGGLSQFAGFAGLAGINLGGGGGGTADIPDMLKSYDLAEIAAEKINYEVKLKDVNPNIVFKTKRDLVESLQEMIKVKPPKGNLLEIAAAGSNKYLITDIANGYIEALKEYYHKMNYTEARKKREYIERELPRVETELRKAEEKLKNFTILSGQNGSAVALDKLGLGSSGGGGGGVEVNRLSREQDIQGSVYMMLRKELENVKLEESKEVEPFMVLDVAKVPKFKVGPKTKLNTMIGLVLGLFGGIFIIFFVEYWKNSHQSIDNKKQ